MPRRFGRRALLSMLVIVGAAVIGTFGQPATAIAHGGGLDKYGCHNDRKAGTYHCHRGPCAPKEFASQAAMLRDGCRKG